ncbi:MAG: glutamate racemase [Candidatus Omnitrophica bacterium]|nr:glutamate racemase [Candidatus Omnitrophota bacterium]
MSKNDRRKPIGVFDSGLGGLTVVKEMMRCLPREDIVYFGDTARVPYGTKSEESIIRFSVENTEILLEHDVKAVVVACNSSSSCAIPALRAAFDLPIISVIEPGAYKAVTVTKNQRVGVIATSATIKSQKYVEAITRLNPAVKVYGKACPLFVPLVEEGWTGKTVTGLVAEEYLRDLIKARVDTLILGCTHYPLLKPVLRRVMGPRVFLVDSASEVAGRARNILMESGLLREDKHTGKYRFLVSDRPQDFSRMASHFLGREIRSVLVRR